MSTLLMISALPIFGTFIAAAVFELVIRVRAASVDKSIAKTAKIKTTLSAVQLSPDTMVGPINESYAK